MTEHISKLLEKIRKRPAMYLGKKSIDGIDMTLEGHMLRAFELDGGTKEPLPGFQKFVEDYYDMHFGQHWSDIIYFYTFHEEVAFEEFFILIDEFYYGKVEKDKFAAFQRSFHCTDVVFYIGKNAAMFFQLFP